MKEVPKHHLSLIFREDLSLSTNGINCLSSTSSSLISGSRDGVVREYNTLDRSLTNLYAGHIHWINSIACSDFFLFSASSDSRIQAWRYEITQPVHTLTHHKDTVHCLKFQENFLYSGGEDNILYRTDLDYKNEELFTFNSSIWHFDYLENLAVVTLASKNFKLLDSRNHKIDIDFKGHSGIVRKVIISPDKSEILTCSSDSYVRLWDVGMRKVKENYHVHNSSVFALKCFWNQGVFVSGDKDGYVYSVDILSHMTEQVCKVSAPVLDVEKVGDEVWVATTDSELASYRNMEEQRKIIGKHRMINYALTDNRKFVVTKDTENIIQVLDILNNKIESSDCNFADTVSKYSSGKISASWFSVSLRLGCLVLDFNGNDCLAGSEIRAQEQIFFIELLLKELFMSVLNQDSDRKGVFDKIWIVFRVLMPKDEIFWMSRVYDAAKGLMYVPKWVKDILPELKNQPIETYLSKSN